MHAFSAAKRTVMTVLCFSLILTAPMALADEEKSGYLGVVLQDITPSMAKALQLGEKSGVMVTEVVADSPAAKAGLDDGDIIMMFQDQATLDYQALTAAVGQAKPGEKVKLVILHNGKEQTLWVELGEREEKNTWTVAGDKDVYYFKGDGDEDIHVEMLKDFHGDGDGEHQVIIKKMIDGEHGEVAFFGNVDRGFMGVQLDDIEGQMAQYFGVENGALITEVNGDSPAAKAGLKAGDVIVKIGDQDIDSPGAVHKAMADTKPEQEVKVKVVRKGDSKTLNVTLGEMPESSVMKNIQIYTSGDDHFSVHAPKMLFHGKDGGVHRAPPMPSKELEWVHENGELEEVKKELKELKKEIEKMKKELKK